MTNRENVEGDCQGKVVDQESVEEDLQWVVAERGNEEEGCLQDVDVYAAGAGCRWA